MALHDHPVHRFMACGIAGLSVAADSLVGDQVRHGQGAPRRHRAGVDYAVEGDYPTYGNNDDRADAIAVRAGRRRSWAKIRRQHTYRDAEPTQSVLTITSNVVYGKHTGNTPDGRRAGEPFAPGANPMNGRDTPRPGRRRAVGGEAALRRRPRRHLADRARSPRTGWAAHRRGADRQPGRRARRLHRRRRLPHQRQRAGPGHAARRDGAPGAVPAADDPGLRVRGELRPAHPRAAARRDVPDLPRRRCEHPGHRRAHRGRPLVRPVDRGGRPRHPVRRVPGRLPAALPVLPQPRHLVPAQRHPDHRRTSCWRRSSKYRRFITGRRRRE